METEKRISKKRENRKAPKKRKNFKLHSDIMEKSNLKILWKTSDCDVLNFCASFPVFHKSGKEFP